MITFMRRRWNEEMRKPLYEAMEKNLAGMNCRNRSEFEYKIKKEDNHEFLDMATAVFKVEHRFLKDYFDKYFDMLSPGMKKSVAYFYMRKFLEPTWKGGS